jgi:hypothetical protein|tara:strand:+ start:60 stop:329 length:270 start_codon:yes stop_codon:yes gene_type:complete
MNIEDEIKLLKKQMKTVRAVLSEWLEAARIHNEWWLEQFMKDYKSKQKETKLESGRVRSEFFLTKKKKKKLINLYDEKCPGPKDKKKLN